MPHIPRMYVLLHAPLGEQQRLLAVTAPITCGCRLHCIRLQASSSVTSWYDRGFALELDAPSSVAASRAGAEAEGAAAAEAAVAAAKAADAQGREA